MAMNTFQQRMLTANATAETFIHAVYTAWDSDRKTLEHLYRPASRIIWNGNPISGSGEMLPFIEQMPASKHDLQAFDCHPLPGATETGQPTISITVSGTVLFYNASEGEPAAPPPRVPGQRAQKRDQNTPREEDPDLLPRLFSHVFIIAPDVNERGTLMYAIQSEAFRFVG